MTRPKSPPKPEVAPLDLDYASADPMAMVNLVREGVPWGLYEATVAELGLTDQAAASVLHIPVRTLARRKGRRLEPQEGERLLRLIRLVARATDVLGDSRKAARWLQAPNRALAGATPISLLDTDIGTQAADDVLGRIEYGVFS